MLLDITTVDRLGLLKHNLNVTQLEKSQSIDALHINHQKLLVLPDQIRLL